MDISALLGYFLTQNWPVTLVQLITGILIGYAFKRSLKYILAAFLILFIASLMNFWSLPSEVVNDLKAIGGEILGELLNIVISILPSALGIGIGVVIGIILA